MIRLLKNFLFGVCFLSMVLVPNYVSAETINMTEIMFNDIQKIFGDPSESISTKIQNADAEISKNPRDAKAYITRGFCYIIENNLEQSFADFDKVIELNPELSSLRNAYIGRGYAFLLKENYNQAIRDYNSALELNQDGDFTAWIYSMRATAYNQIEDYDQAIQDFSTAIQLDPNNSMLYASRVISYLYNGDFELALRDCNKAILLAGSNFEASYAYLMRGSVYATKNELDRAEADFQKALEMTPNSETVQMLLNLIRQEKAEQ